MPHRPISPSRRNRSRGNSFLSSWPAAPERPDRPRTHARIRQRSADLPSGRSHGPRPKRISGLGPAVILFAHMRLYNSLSRQVEEVKPADGRTVKMYSCGPTVYRYIHIGNMRSFMLGDIIRRGLRFEGQDVLWIMNITDVGHMTDEVTDTGRDQMELAEAD